MSEPETLAYILLKGLYVCGIVCGLTPPLLLIAVLFTSGGVPKMRMLLARARP